MVTRQMLISEADRARLEKTIGLFAGHAHEEWDSIRHLEQELSQASILNPKEVPTDVVTMNSTTLLHDLDSGAEEAYSLVYPSYSAVAPDKVSVLSPLGTALLGSRVGDVLACMVGGRARRFQVVDVLYQPEASGHYFL